MRTRKSYKFFQPLFGVSYFDNTISNLLDDTGIYKNTSTTFGKPNLAPTFFEKIYWKITQNHL